MSARAPTIPPGPDWRLLRSRRSLESLILPFLHSVHSATSRFVVYKLPRGLRYKYMDGDSRGWREGADFINSSAGAVGRSLLPLYRSNASQVKGRQAQPGVAL